MTKREQVGAVAAATGLTPRQARDAIDAVVAVIKVGLIEGEKVRVDGLGHFEVHRRGPRRLMNPQTGVMMDVPAKTVPRFRFSPELRKLVEERHANE